MILDEAASRRLRGRKSSLVAWETSLEDVLETEGEWGLDEDEEGTVLEAADGEDTTVEEGQQVKQTAPFWIKQAPVVRLYFFRNTTN